MTKRVYLLTLADARESMAGVILCNLGAYVLYVDQNQSIPDEHRDSERVAVIVANEGHFPSKYLRVFSTVDRAKQREFELPEQFEPFLDTERPTAVVVVKRRACQADHRLDGAFHDFHHRNLVTGKWIGPKKKKVSRARRSMEFFGRSRYALG